MDVAGRHREPVALAYGFRPDHPDTEVKIACHLCHHAELLEVLLAEHRKIRAALHEQLADDGRNTAEEMRPEAIFQSRGGCASWNDLRCEAIRVHRLDVGIPDDVHRFGGELGDIGLP